MRELRIGVAWMKRSGLSRIANELGAFRKSGGHAEAIVGIDEGGATRQGLEDALLLFDDVRVFHDPARRTFHPKVYLAWGDQSAVVLVGSSNLTAGGLYSNYEASLLTETEFEDDGDMAFVQMMRSWFETIQADSDVCLPLTQELLTKLVSDPRYRIGDESVRMGPSQAQDDGVTEDSSGNSVFGKSKSEKKGGIPTVAKPSTSASATKTITKKPVVSGRGSTAGGVAAAPAITHRWWKKMSPSDAQHPPNPNSAITGNLKLTQAGHDIDHEQYFRNDLFAGQQWAGKPVAKGVREEAIVPFEVTTMGTSRGTVPLKVDHADFRIAAQNNVPTWLHWGLLQPVLRANNWTGQFVVIQRLSDGAYTLDITGTQP